MLDNGFGCRVKDVEEEKESREREKERESACKR